MRIKCIYCQKQKPIEEFSRREHVLPESFGAFKDNFLLKKTVCDDCNKFFGDNLELNLGRDSIEGILRFEYGKKPAKEYKSLGRRSGMLLQVGDGPFEGAYVYFEYSTKENDIIIKQLPQIGFVEDDLGKTTWHLIHEIPEREELIERGVKLKKRGSIKILACNLDKAILLLKEKGIDKSFEKEGQFCFEKTEKGYPLKVSCPLSDEKLRAVAKIAFNYLAYWEKSPFVLDSNFNAIRNFILNGERPNYEIIQANTKPIFFDELFSKNRRIGHIITVNWGKNGVSIVSQVSLFNFLTYQIGLSREFSGEHIQLTRGHFFNIRDGKILDMGTKREQS